MYADDDAAICGKLQRAVVCDREDDVSNAVTATRDHRQPERAAW